MVDLQHQGSGQQVRKGGPLVPVLTGGPDGDQEQQGEEGVHVQF